MASSREGLRIRALKIVQHEEPVEIKKKEAKSAAQRAKEYRERLKLRPDYEEIKRKNAKKSQQYREDFKNKASEEEKKNARDATKRRVQVHREQQTQKTPDMNKDSESQQQSSLRTQVWDRLQRTGYASLATESTVSQIIEMLMNDTLESEEQLAALFDIKPETPDMNKDSESQQQSSLRTQVWDRLQRTGFANQATESTVSQIIEMLMNDTLESEEQLAALFDIKPEPKDVDVEDCDNPLDERLHEDFHLEIDIDQSAVSCVKLPEISENDTKDNFDPCSEPSSTSQNMPGNGSGADGKEEMFQKEKTFPHRSALHKHTKNHSGKKPYHCLTCGKAFASPSQLQTHSRIHSGDKPYQCLTCGKAFAQSSNLQKHSRIHSGDKPYQCLTCGKAFVQSSDLQKHSRIHSGDRPYQCLTCGKAFAQSSDLQKHSRIHSGEKPYKCPPCGKAFADHSALCKHSRIHSEEKPYQCLTCGKAFAHSSYLHVHSRIHSGDKPYQCLTCGKAFAQSSNLQKHSRIHSGDKPYQCLTCGKAFVQSSDLQKHSRIHSGEKPYQCPTCGKAFADHSALRKHSRIHS